MSVCMGLHRKGKDIVIGICDSELLGNVFSNGDLVLDLVKYSAFYGKEEDEEIIKKNLIGATTINIVGEKAIEIAVKSGVITKKDLKNTIEINGIKHLQVFR